MTSFDMDSFHAVEWRGSLHRAKIIDKRSINCYIEYYVHYVHCKSLLHFSSYYQVDRRMDEWIPASRIHPQDMPDEPKPQYSTLAFPENRKLTRNMKRKFEEMNIQKVSFIHFKCS